jgi:hypothetical protein
MSVTLSPLSTILHSPVQSPTLLDSFKMSLKIIHTRPDGTKVPLKVSIWDAFKGVPDRKPRKIAPVKVSFEDGLMTGMVPC